MGEKQQTKSGLATAALVLGIIGVVLSFIPIINNAAFVLGVLALIFAVIALARHRGGATAVVSVVLAVAAIGITLAVQKAAVDTLNKVSDDVNKSLDDSTGKNTDDVLKNDVDVSFASFVVTTGDFGVKDGSLEVTVKNKASEQHSYVIQVEAVAADGTRIAEDTVYANNLGAGQSQQFKAFTLVASDVYDSLEAATFKVVTVSKS